MTGPGVDAIKSPAAARTSEQTVTGHEQTMHDAVLLHCPGHEM